MLVLEDLVDRVRACLRSGRRRGRRGGILSRLGLGKGKKTRGKEFSGQEKSSVAL